MTLPVRPIQVESPARREFCAYVCHTAAMVAAVTFAGCGGSDSPTAPSGGGGGLLGSVPASVSGRVVSVTVDAASPLAPVGGAAIASTSLGTFLLARSSQDALTALTATCTHEGCTVTNFNGSQFVCPCHGSRFTTSGGVANGPATRALQSYPTQFANGVVTFTV